MEFSILCFIAYKLTLKIQLKHNLDVLVTFFFIQTPKTVSLNSNNIHINNLLY